MIDQKNLYSEAEFSAPSSRITSFGEFVKKYAKLDVSRIIDIGSGSGELVVELSKLFPSASVTGNDVSAPNVKSAHEKTNGLDKSFRDRIEFILDDYLKLKTEPYDLIVSYSCLNLIPTELDNLVSKLAVDLKPDGLLIMSIPNGCAYNKILILFRRMLGMIRGRMTDRIIFHLARLFLDSSVSDERIRHNLVYMYIAPSNLFDRDFVRSANKHNFTIEYVEDDRAESVFKLRHSSVVLKKLEV